MQLNCFIINNQYNTPPKAVNFNMDKKAVIAVITISTLCVVGTVVAVLVVEEKIKQITKVLSKYAHSRPKLMFFGH